MSQFRKYLNKISDNYFADLNESPVAVIGDRDGFKDNKSIHISKKGFDKGLYEIVGETKYKDRKMYICHEKRIPDMYFFGVFGKEEEREVFVAFAQLKIIRRDDLKQIGYKNPIQMSKVEVHNQRLSGIGKTFYRWFIMNKYTIISDLVQFDGARALYDSLSRDSDIIADIIDDQERHFLKTDVRVDSGKEDWDFDTELWSYDFDKANIRIALYKK